MDTMRSMYPPNAIIYPTLSIGLIWAFTTVAPPPSRTLEEGGTTQTGVLTVHQIAITDKGIEWVDGSNTLDYSRL